MAEEEVLDVTVIQPWLKHKTIYEHFDALKEGEAFIIHNDHDPKPLYYALINDKGKTFDWDYLQEGPKVWEVRIGKKK